MAARSTLMRTGEFARIIVFLCVFQNFALLFCFQFASAQPSRESIFYTIEFDDLKFDSYFVDCVGTSNLANGTANQNPDSDGDGTVAMSLAGPANGKISGLCAFNGQLEISNASFFHTTFGFNASGSSSSATGTKHIVFFVAGGCGNASDVANSGCPGSLTNLSSNLLVHFALTSEQIISVDYYVNNGTVNASSTACLPAPEPGSMDKTYVWIDYDGQTNLSLRSRTNPDPCENPSSFPTISFEVPRLSQVLNALPIIGFFESDIDGPFTGWASVMPSALRVDVWHWSFSTIQEVGTSYDDDDQCVNVPHKKFLNRVLLLSAIFIPPGVALLLVLGFAVFFYRHTRRQRMQNNSLLRANKELEDERTRLLSELKLLDFGAREIPYKELEEATHGFADAIGEGGFGVVFKGTLPGIGSVAVKRIKRTKENVDDAKQLVAEVQVIGRVRHVNIVPLHGWCYENEIMLLVYKFVDNADLDAHLFPKNPSAPAPLAWTKRMKALRGVAAALVFLHEEFESKETVIHRDIKPTNVMLDSEFNARLGDFGLARLSKRSEIGHQSERLAGTFGYLAPEYPLGATTETDVYSFGTLILVVVTARKPLDRSIPGGEGLVRWVRSLHDEDRILEAGDPNLRGNEWSLQDQDEMQRALKVGLSCCLYEPSDRPTMREALTALQGAPAILAKPLAPQFPVPIHYPQFGNWSSTFESNAGSTAYASESVSLLSNSHDNQTEYPSDTVRSSFNIPRSFSVDKQPR